MSGGVPAGEGLPVMLARLEEDMKHASRRTWMPVHVDYLRAIMDAAASTVATPTPPPSRDADVERNVRIILQAIADAHSEDCIGSIDVDIPEGGYPRQWLRAAVHTALQSLGERG